MKKLLAGALLAVAGPAAAQDGWTFALSPYVWLPGASTSTETGRGTINIDTSASDAIADLDFAFMGALEARKGRWGLILDLIYADVSAREDTPLGLLWSEAKVDTRLTAFTTYAAYRVVEDERGALDLLAGGRFYSLDIDVSLEAGVLPGGSRSFDADWADPVLGLRGRYDFDESWFVTGLADAGGFTGGSASSWQAFASIGYQFDPRWSVQGGWRYMALDKEIDGQDVEIDLSGPIFGFTVRF